jgi:nitrate/nitrite transporter NarK
MSSLFLQSHARADCFAYCTRALLLVPLMLRQWRGPVGGIVGVLGRLGGFVCPILFGYMLKGTGIWTTTWMFFLVLAVACLGWMRWTVRKMTLKHAPDLAHQIEEPWASGRD